MNWFNNAWSLLPEEGEVLIFGDGQTPEVGEIVDTESDEQFEITRSLGGPNHMCYGKPIC